VISARNRRDIVLSPLFLLRTRAGSSEDEKEKEPEAYQAELKRKEQRGGAKRSSKAISRDLDDFLDDEDDLGAARGSDDEDDDLDRGAELCAVLGMARVLARALALEAAAAKSPRAPAV
jgi:hypothetical protein